MLLLFVLVTNTCSVNRILRIRAFRPIPSPPVSTYPSPVLTVRMPLRSKYLVRQIPWSEWLGRTLYCLIMHDSPTKFVFPFSRLRAFSFRLRFLRYYLFLLFRRTYTWLLFLLNPLDSPLSLSWLHYTIIYSACLIRLLKYYRIIHSIIAWKKRDGG